MAVLIYSELETFIKDKALVNVSIDVPVTSAEMLRAINDAYQIVWEAEAPSLRRVASATAWTSAELATGIVQGILTDIKDVQQIFASTTSGSVGISSGDYALDRVEYEVIQYLRGATGHGSYGKPNCFALVRPAIQTADTTAVGKLELHYFPGVIGFYFPTHYVPIFTPMDGGAGDFPDVSDLGSRDIGWIASSDIAQRLGRHDLVPGLLMHVSETTLAVLKRRAKSLTAGDQDREEAA